MCGIDEPQTTTDTNGAYNFTIPDGYDNARYEFLVDVPPNAVDSDNPNQVVGKSYVMRAPFYERSIITPLTTIVAAHVANGLDLASAKRRVADDLGLPTDFDFAKDYIAESDVRAHNAAKVVARILQTQSVGNVSEILTAVANNRAAIRLAATSSTAYTSSQLDTAIAAIVPEFPTISASPPPNVRAAITIYSDSYEPVAGVNTNPNWGQQTISKDLALLNNRVVQLKSLNYQGIEFSVQDVSDMNALHVDIWSQAGQQVTLKLVSSAAALGASAARESSVTLTLNSGWNSIDLPLSNFSVPDLERVDQLVWVGEGSPTIVYDNIYFWDDPNQVVEENESTLPGTFEDFESVSPPTLGDFGQGGITRVVADPTDSNNNVAEFTKVAGGPSWNGMFWTLATPLKFHGTTATVTTRVWVDRATTTPNELFVETAAGQSSQVTASNAGPWVANSWQTITWTFTGLDSNAIYTKIGFAPNRGGQTSVNETYYLDKIILNQVRP
jgi:hypothetical protein